MQAKSEDIVLIHVKRIEFIALIDSSVSKSCPMLWDSDSPLLCCSYVVVSHRNLKYCLLLTLAGN